MEKHVALGAPSPLLKKSLIDRGYSVIDLPRFSLLSEPVASHADMLFSRVCGKLITSSAYYSEAKDQLKRISGDIVIDGHGYYSRYPDEARFNALFHQGYLFANGKCVSPYILDLCMDKNIPFVHVNQGYAACSAAVCGKGIITADPSIYSAVLSRGIPVLKISEGNVTLDGYSYGFIGGASGFSSCDSTLYFNGDVSAHPDYGAIVDFARSMRVRVASLGSWHLSDCGGLIFF